MDLLHLLDGVYARQYFDGGDGIDVSTAGITAAHLGILCSYDPLTPSRAPTTGGQYHWVSEFSPRKYQKFLSYLMGWLCVLGWQGGCASSSFMAGTMIQGLIALNRPGTYVPEAWHGTLLTIAVAAFAVFFNTFLARHLPIIESGLLAIHFLAFIGILATLWAMSPHISGATVFTQFNDGGGWNSLGVSTLAGITSGILPLLGADAAAHMVCIIS